MLPLLASVPGLRDPHTLAGGMLSNWGYRYVTLANFHLCPCTSDGVTCRSYTKLYYSGPLGLCNTTEPCLFLYFISSACHTSFLAVYETVKAQDGLLLPRYLYSLLLYFSLVSNQMSISKKSF